MVGDETREDLAQRAQVIASAAHLFAVLGAIPEARSVAVEEHKAHPLFHQDVPPHTKTRDRPVGLG